MKKILFTIWAISAFANAQFDEDTQDLNPLEGLYEKDKSGLFSDPLREMDAEDDQFFDDLQTIHTHKKVEKPPARGTDFFPETQKKSK